MIAAVIGLGVIAALGIGFAIGVLQVRRQPEGRNS
jgi:hypothetical protein